MARSSDVIEAAMPYRGACGMCGGPDARHREWDAWRDMRRAGASAARIARWYERPAALVRAVVALSPQQYGALLRRPRAAARGGAEAPAGSPRGRGVGWLRPPKTAGSDVTDERRA